MIMYILILALLIIMYYMYKYSNKLTPKQLNVLIKNNDYDYLLDVRTPEEWKLGHHPKATLLPIGTFVTELPKTITNKNAKILIYCKKGIRAEASAKIAQRLGYTNVYWMDGTWEDLSKLI